MHERREAVIDPAQPYPIKAGARYDLSPYTLEKLEKLARARFEIGRFTSETFIGPNNTDEAALRNIAQSVNASSEIEGEEIPAEKLDLALAAATRPTALVSARRRPHALDRARHRYGLPTVSARFPTGERRSRSPAIATVLLIK